MTQIKLEAGKKYRNRRGEVVEIAEERPDLRCSFISGRNTYAPNGMFWSDGREQTIYDLIEEVIDEPAMKPHKHAELIKQWADGSEIQQKGTYTTWTDFLGWWCTTGQIEYRIKPEPKPDVVTYYNLFCKNNPVRSNEHHAHIKLIWDGETGKIKDAEVLA